MENWKEMVLRNTFRKKTSIYGNPSVFPENDLYAANLATVAIASAIGDV